MVQAYIGLDTPQVYVCMSVCVSVCVDTRLSEISATVTDPSGVEDECDISEETSGVYQVLFRPRETGVHYIAVRHRHSPVPGTH